MKRIISIFFNFGPVLSFIFLFSFSLLALSAHAGKNIGVRCDESSGKGSFHAIDLYPATEYPFILKGFHEDLPERQQSFSFQSFRHPVILKKVIYFSQHLVLLQFMLESKEFPLLTTPSGPPFRRIQEMTLINTNPEIHQRNGERKGEVILHFLEGEVKKLHYRNCHFFGAKVQDWNSMWNP